MALYIMQFYILGRLRPNIVLGIHRFVDIEWDGDLDLKNLQAVIFLTYLEEQLVG